MCMCVCVCSVPQNHAAVSTEGKNGYTAHSISGLLMGRGWGWGGGKNRAMEMQAIIMHLGFLAHWGGKICV